MRPIIRSKLPISSFRILENQVFVKLLSVFTASISMGFSAAVCYHISSGRHCGKVVKTMSENTELERARRALRIIRQVSYNVLTGRTAGTSALTFDGQNSIYHWRTLWGMIWGQTYEGLSENLPDPPPWPVETDKQEKR